MKSFYEMLAILESNSDLFHASGKVVGKNVQVGPFKTRQEAVEALFKKHPDATEVMSGHGSNQAGGDIRWHKKPKGLSEAYDDQENSAYKIIEQALQQAGLPWDQEEFNVLYGKLVDMDIYVSPDRTQRVQGMVDADRYEDGRIVDFQINNKEFNPADIAAIHSIKVQLTYNALVNAWREEWEDDRDYEKTLRMLPR
jgi:hypothetical protein